MKFVSCRIINREFLVNVFSKEYNKTLLEKTVKIPIENSSEFFREFDYIDLVVPGNEVLYFARNYPSVKQSYIKKIVVQDIEVETPFKESDLIIDMKVFPGFSETNVFCIKKDVLKEMLELFDPASREKIRSIVPEEMLLYKSPEKIEKALFFGDIYTTMVLKNGQIVKTGGLNDLKKEMISCFNGNEPEKELDSWLSVSGDLGSTEGLSDMELLIRKTVESFFARSVSFFAPFSGPAGETAVFINDSIVPGIEKILESIDPLPLSQTPFIVYSQSESLEMIPEIVDADSAVNFAAGEFAYKGGFSFLKKRIILAVVFYLIALVMLITGMQIKTGYLDERISAGEERTKTLMREVVGKEMPSLRQALSIMEKTIKGETSSADKKSVFPYSALYIMEVIFPYFTFENSTIEVSELSIKEEGKIRVSGTSDTLEDINKFTEFLDSDPMIGEVNRGQINTRNEKSSFNISFSYAGPKKEDTKTKKGKKKTSAKETENEI